MPGSSHTLQQGHQGSATPPRWSVIEILSRTKPGKRPSRTGGKCLRCQSSDSISSSISNATGSGGESETSVASAQAQSAVYSGSAILCSVNSANNTRKLNLILSKSHQKRGERFAVGTNLQNKLPASSADCHLSPSAETNIRTTTTADPPRSPSCPPCPYSHLHFHRHWHRHRHRHRPRHSQQHHRHYRHRGCRCRCRDASQSASASPASMLLPYQINQRATLLQHSATATTTATTATISTTLPHVPGAATTKNVSLRAVPRIFKRKRDTVQTATTASPLTPQQHPTVAAATSTTTTRRSRLEFILYTEVYQVEEDSVSPSDFNPQSNVGSDDPFWQNYGK
ncbi:histone-lysine N-methyltransferase Suv4-20 [Drosophila yakuba]|nr:histone-lysine N-methyltransferase Suv4-20 [Drosophila yakuba]